MTQKERSIKELVRLAEYWAIASDARRYTGLSVYAIMDATSKCMYYASQAQALGYQW